MVMVIASAVNVVASPQVRAPLGRSRVAVDSLKDSLPLVPRDTARFKKDRAVDIDNVVKAVADALNGLAYADDSQIVYVVASKTYSEFPETVVTIWEM